MIVKKAGQLVTERSLDGNARTSTVTGLTNKLPYSFTVSAVNGAGQAGKVDRGEAPRCPAGRIRADLAEQAARVIGVAWSESAPGTYALGRYTVLLYSGYGNALAAQPEVERSAVVLPISSVR